MYESPLPFVASTLKAGSFSRRLHASTVNFSCWVFALPNFFDMTDNLPYKNTFRQDHEDFPSSIRSFLSFEHTSVFPGDRWFSLDLVFNSFTRDRAISFDPCSIIFVLLNPALLPAFSNQTSHSNREAQYYTKL